MIVPIIESQTYPVKFCLLWRNIICISQRFSRSDLGLFTDSAQDLTSSLWNLGTWSKDAGHPLLVKVLIILRRNDAPNHYDHVIHLLCKQHLHQLLYTEYTGEAAGFIEKDWPDDDPRPLYYINKVGDGEVLYLNLGHCRGHYDMKPVVDYYPQIEKGSWDKPQFYELLRRGIRYCAGMSA